MTRIQHLMEALHHINQAGGSELDLVRRQLQFAIAAIYEADTKDLRGVALIDRLDDEQLAAAIRIKDERLELHAGPHLSPQIFNYIRHQRPRVASVEFSRRS
ncbi:MAG: hypothetical protein AAF609_22400 [Cyanobacteria bacterium P01_C01_bin.120]